MHMDIDVNVLYILLLLYSRLQLVAIYSRCNNEYACFTSYKQETTVYRSY